MNQKKLLGQFFTTTNPFDTVAFYKWLEIIPDDIKKGPILEPFAGANNIPRMLLDSDMLQANWDCFDISPPAYNQCPQFKINQKDTIVDFPRGYKIGITNPPYLSKNSATRSHLQYPATIYDDIYKLCLEKMLENLDYVAAIIPETFLTAKIFTSRLIYVVSLTCKMFEDTDCPVCLALFVPYTTADFTVYQMNNQIGKYTNLQKGIIHAPISHHWIINDPLGKIGINCIDNTKQASIAFCEGETIPSYKIKYSSRSITRVSGLPDGIDRGEFLNTCNQLLNKYRTKTQDVFLASFKGLRADMKYRRRLDFATAKQIMSQALFEVQNAKH